MDYLGLKSAIADWLNRTDLNSVIPTFIELAEAEMNRKLRVAEMEARATVTVTEPFVELPSDFLQFRRLVLSTPSGPRQLDVLSAEQFAEYAAAHTAAGTPSVASVVGQALQLSPSPDTSYVLEMLYYRQLPKLSATQTTNWLLEKYPDAYLYGALQHSAPYLRDDERVAVWSQKFTSVLREIALHDERVLFGNAKLAASNPIRW